MVTPNALVVGGRERRHRSVPVIDQTDENAYRLLSTWSTPAARSHGPHEAPRFSAWGVPPEATNGHEIPDWSVEEPSRSDRRSWVHIVLR